MNNFKITKREIIFSIVIACLMLFFGFLIAEKINERMAEKYHEYETALQIVSDAELFKHGMATSVGNTFIYGDLKAIDTVTFEEIGGEYSYIKKEKERYTRKSRPVTKTRTKSDGTTETYIETEYYYEWDVVGTWEKHSDVISFLGIEFKYGTINFPHSSHIKTIRETSSIRYNYYGVPADCVGTVYANLKDDTIVNAKFYNNKSINKTIEYLTSGIEVIIFWVMWTIFTAGLIAVFYYVDNRWLEDKNKSINQYL